MEVDKVPALLTKTESDLDVSISKVGTPPVKYAQLQFRIFDPTSPDPVMAKYITPDADGIYTAEFTTTNISDTTASMVDIWVQVCEQCSYAVEPAGFDKPQGIPEQNRHRTFQILNPGVSFEKMTIKFKIVGGPFAFTEVQFHYSCSTCGKLAPAQTIKYYLLPYPMAQSN